MAIFATAYIQTNNMKRNLLISLCFAAALPGFAGDDVSSCFLINNGFDTRFNYDASHKGNVAGDIINEVYGWDNETTATYTVAGTFAWNPLVTFNSSTALPAEGYNGSTGGALGLSTGKGMRLAYSQAVTLPKGTYRLCAAYYNVGSSVAGQSLLAWVPGNGDETASAVGRFPVKEWTTDTLTFTLNTRTTGRIRIGFAAREGIEAQKQAKILVDYVKLLCEQTDKNDLRLALSTANNTYTDGNGAYANELKAVIDEAQTVYDDENATPGAIISATEQLKTATQTYKYKNASPTKPLQMTTFITNPSFEDGTTGWIINGMSPQTNKNFPYKTGATYLEKWVNLGTQVPDVSIRQTIKGLPNGNYSLRVAAGHIQQSSMGSATNVGDKQTGASLFAGFYEVPVDTMKRTKVMFFTVVDGQVTIGLKTENATGNWVCVDNFVLYYLGDCATTDYTNYLNTYINRIRTILQTKHMQAAARQEAEAIIEAVSNTATSDSLDETAVLEAKTQLDNAVAVIEASLARCKTLSDAIEEAEKVSGWYEDEPTKHNKMETAIQTALETLNNAASTDAQLKLAVQKLQNVTKSVDKKVYTAQWSMGDVNNPENAYYIGRTRHSKNWILFWEKEYGENPDKFICGSHVIDVDEVLRQAETAFRFYTDSLKFIKRGKSKTDTYKMVIRLRYEPTGWEATGSGVDNLIGLLTLTPWAAPSRSWQTLYHEVGHCFQYQTHCDNNDQNGWMYAPGNGNGCAFWEQCAQWQAYKIMPFDQFTNEWFSGYLSNVHKHILHESPRYNNYFVQDYWCYKHGIDIIGRLWNQSYNPEDAIETYKRITDITDAEFFDEMYDCAARFATWDIPALEPYGASKIDDRPQPAMTQVADKFWRIDATVAPENTGHNIIKLNAPGKATTVSACFKGLNNQPGYRVKNATSAEWRYGFVAQLTDGNRVYGDMHKSTYAAPTDTLYFDCPANCQRLYFVVSGGARNYWRQVWDDDDSNDEQWPYQVKFGNTNRFGHANLDDATDVENFMAADEIPAITLSGRTLHVGQSSQALTLRVVTLSGVCTRECAIGQSAVNLTLPSGFHLIQLQTADGHNLLTRKVMVK